MRANVATIVTLMFLCISCRPVERGKEISIAVPFRAYSLPLYIAQENKLFANNGLNVVLYRTETGHDAYERVAQGISYMAIVPEGIACRAMYDERVVILGVLTVASDEERIVYRRDRIRDMKKDLPDARVGFLQNSVSGDLFFDLYCEKYGIKKNTVKKESLSFTQLSDRLVRGELDAVVIIEPYAGMLHAKNRTDFEVHTETGMYTKFIYVVAHAMTYELYPREFHALFDSLIQAERTMYSDAEEVARVSDLYLGKGVFQPEKLFLDYHFYLHVPHDSEEILSQRAFRLGITEQKKHRDFLRIDLYTPHYLHRVQQHREFVE